MAKIKVLEFDKMIVMRPVDLGLLLLKEIRRDDQNHDIDYEYDRMTYIKNLINAGASLEIRTLGGKTPLIYAASYCATDIIKELIGGGANVNAKDNEDSTALHFAIKWGCDGIAKMLIEAGALLDVHTKQGYTPLMLANSKISTLHILLEAGADIDACTRGGNTALHFAVKDVRPTVINELLKYGASTKMKNIQGKTPWDIASWELRSKYPQLNPDYNG